MKPAAISGEGRSNYRQREKATLAATRPSSKKSERPEVEDDKDEQSGNQGLHHSPVLMMKKTRKLTLQLIRLRALSEEERKMPADVV